MDFVYLQYEALFVLYILVCRVVCCKPKHRVDEV